MDQGLLTGAVFIDLRKAFDTVDHDLLLEKLAMGYGVTGKELGPLLFVLFINDLPTAISKSGILLYADDAVVFAAHKNIKILQETLNAELDEVNKWTLSNFLSSTKE